MNRRYQRTASTITSGGNRNPANADFGGSHARDLVEDFTAQVCLGLANAQRNRALLAGNEAPDSAAAELRSWAVIRNQSTEQTAWGAHPADLALEVLDHIAEPVAEQVRADLVAAVLAEQPTSNWHNHFNVVLDYAFPQMESDHGRTFEELTAAQRPVALWLMQNPHVFGPSGPDIPLRQYGLPTTYEALRAYADADG